MAGTLFPCMAMMEPDLSSSLKILKCYTQGSSLVLPKECGDQGSQVSMHGYEGGRECCDMNADPVLPSCMNSMQSLVMRWLSC